MSCLQQTCEDSQFAVSMIRVQDFVLHGQTQKQDVFNVKGWGEMVIIEAREWMASPYANRFGNSMEQVEEFAGWENRSC